MRSSECGYFFYIIESQFIVMQVKNIILPYYEEDNITGGIQKLISSARKMWEMKNPRFIDDITIILIFFR